MSAVPRTEIKSSLNCRISTPPEGGGNRVQKRHGSDSSHSHARNSPAFYNWELGTINIRTGSEETNKMYTVASEADRAGLLVCGVQELRFTNQGSRTIELANSNTYDLYWSGYKCKREAGVGILIRRDPRVQVVDIIYSRDQAHRIIAASLLISGYAVKVIVCYAPTDATNTSDSARDLFYRGLRSMTTTDHKRQKLMVIGDFNATTGLVLRPKACYFNGSTVIPDPLCKVASNGERMKTFCRQYQLSIAQTYFSHRRLHRYSWYSNDHKTRKCLDYVLADKSIMKYVKDCRVRRGFEFETDHKLLKTSLRTPTCRGARRKHCKKSPSTAKYSLKTLQDDTIRGKYEQAISKSFRKPTGQPSIDKPSSSSEQQQVNTQSDQIISSILMAADEVIPKQGRKKKRSDLWAGDTILNELLQKRTKTAIKSSGRKQLTKDIRRRLNYLRNVRLCAEAKSLNEHATKRQIEELFRRFKQDDWVQAKTTSKCDPEKLQEFFNEHFNPIFPDNDPTEFTELPGFVDELQQLTKSSVIETGPPDVAEIRKTLSKLKNNKASNDIPSELLKYASQSDELVSEIESLLANIWETQLIPTSWGHTKLTALWKGAAKGSSKDPKAYRGLQVGSSLCKMLVIILLNRLKEWYDGQLLDQQQGFRSGRGTADGIYVTKRVQQVTDRMKTEAYVLFVDLSAAFDHVNRDWLFKSIKLRFPEGTDHHAFDLLESLYSNTTTALAETPDNKFQLSSGVRQGGPESPFLYNLYMDFVMRTFMDECKAEGVEFLDFNYRVRDEARDTTMTRSDKSYKGRHTVDWSGYADDLELFFKNQQHLQRALIILDRVFTRYHLKINVGKTKTIVFNYAGDDSDYPGSFSALNNKPVENVRVFRYLGDDIKYDQSATGDAELSLRISSAEAAFAQHKSRFTNKNTWLHVKVDILNAIVRSRLTYSCQTWNLTANQKSKLDSVYVRFLRRLIPNGYKRKVSSSETRDDDENQSAAEEAEAFKLQLSNSEVLKLCQQEELSEFTGRAQCMYLAHLSRQPHQSLTKRLLFNEDRYKKRGNRIKTLEEQVLTSVNKTSQQFYPIALRKQELDLCPKPSFKSKPPRKLKKDCTVVNSAVNLPVNMDKAKSAPRARQAGASGAVGRRLTRASRKAGSPATAM